jgi:hypothetical protein
LDIANLINELKKEIDEIDRKCNYLKEQLKITIYGDLKLKAHIDELIQKQQKLKEDLKVLKTDNVNFYDALKIKSSKILRDLSIMYDNFFIEKEIKDQDYNDVTDILKDFNAPIIDFEITIKINKLKDKENKIYANRDIIVKNIKTGKAVTYKAGFEATYIWQEKLREDIKENQHEWF